MKKKIIIIILLIIVLMISTLFMPFSFAFTKPNDEYENVMNESISNLNARVVDIAMLGAHDAFSNGISRKSSPNYNEGGITTNKLVNSIAKGLVVRMSKAQRASAKEMLYAGVRYFDVRISLVDGKYYSYHGYLSYELDGYVKDIIDFLETHPGEFVIFDIQHFYTSNGSNTSLSKDEYENLLLYLMSIETENGHNLLDFVHYDSKKESVGSLTYSNVTKAKEEGGVVIFAKTHDFSSMFYRDGDASYSNDNYENVRSLWHNMNSTKKMIDAINYEFDYIKEKEFNDILIVDQAQKTAFIMNASIVRSLFEWSLIDMAASFNKALVRDKDMFTDWLNYMPILMVDYSTSNKGNFNKLANEYICEFNEKL